MYYITIGLERISRKSYRKKRRDLLELYPTKIIKDTDEMRKGKYYNKVKKVWFRSHAFYMILKHVSKGEKLELNSKFIS